jgi:hypothetical protein
MLQTDPSGQHHEVSEPHILDGSPNDFRRLFRHSCPPLSPFLCHNADRRPEEGNGIQLTIVTSLEIIEILTKLRQSTTARLEIDVQS